VLDRDAEHKSTSWGSNFLGARPTRNPYVNWKETKKGVVIYLRGKKISLDNIGSTVWKACDGRNTVEDISRVLNERYMLSVGEAERSLNIYFEQLVKKGLVFIKFGETQATTERPPERPPYNGMLPASDGSTVFCGYCGTQNSKISNYCIKCGQKLVK